MSLAIYPWFVHWVLLIDLYTGRSQKVRIFYWRPLYFSLFDPKRRDNNIFSRALDEWKNVECASDPARWVQILEAKIKTFLRIASQE